MYKIYILSTGIGKSRTLIFERNILKLGGVVKNSITSDETTHVVVDDQMSFKTVCSLLKIDANKIPSFKIVKSMWLSSCINAKKFFESIDYEIKHCNENINEELMNTDKTNDRDGTNCHNKHSSLEIDQESDYSDEDTSFENNSIPNHVKSKWICMESSKKEKINHNKHVTDILEQLMVTYEQMNEKWRALSYKKAIISLKKHPSEITTFEEAKALQGVGDKLAEKIWEIVESGKLRKLDEISETDEAKALGLFTKVWGAGPKTAQMWVAQGFRTLKDLEENAHLTKCQTIGLKYYNDLNERMDRTEVQKIESIVRAEVDRLKPGSKLVVCGSYRRGQTTCGDVDILISHPDGSSHVGLFDALIDSLTKSGFLTDELITAHDGLQRKYLGLCKLLESNSKHRRIDIIVTPHNEFYAALVYFTGSGHFNRSMRHMASKMNMSLNEHGLYNGVLRNNGVKTCSGATLPITSEESIFKYLGVPFRPPEERDY